MTYFHKTDDFSGLYERVIESFTEAMCSNKLISFSGFFPKSKSVFKVQVI